MLNKEICHKCCSTRNEFINFYYNWEEDGKVFCCAKYIKKIGLNGYWDIKKEPPKDCPFILEQLMANENAK